MEQVFITLLNTSITAGYLVLAVLLLRPLLKKAPKYIRCILWGFVGLRLILPFSLESITSLIPSAQPIPPEIVTDPVPTVQTGFSVLNSAINPILSESMAPVPGDSANPMQIAMGIAWNVWLLGVILMALYSIVSYSLLRGKLREAIREEGSIWLCDRVSTPFLLGLFRPRIYLPSNLNAEDRGYVLAHETAHLCRKDHWWKPIGFLLLTVYWFNPLMWVAYIFLCRDIEFACDEKVIKELGENEKKSYSQALINCSVPKKMISACPVAFGEDGVKGRIKSVLNYKKPAFWIVLIAIILCIAVAVCFLTNPPEDSAGQAKRLWFKAAVIEVRENSLLVKPIDGEAYFSGAQEVVVKLNGKDPESYQADCRVVVYFDGMVQELYPPIVPNAHTIINLDSFYSPSTEASPGQPLIATVDELFRDHIIVKSQLSLPDNLSYSYFRIDTNPAEFSVGDTVTVSYDGVLHANQSAYPILQAYSIRVIVPAETSQEPVADNNFNATVLEVQEAFLLVKPFADEYERTISSQLLVSTKQSELYGSPNAAFTVGDQIHVAYDGTITEGQPPVITNVNSIAHLASFDFALSETVSTPDHAAFDIDNDGFIEDCYVKRDSTTSSCHFIVYAYQNGVLEYCNQYWIDTHCRFLFSGTESYMFIAAVDYYSGETIDTYSISVEGFNLVLKNAKGKIDYSDKPAPILPTLHTMEAKYPQYIRLDASQGLHLWVTYADGLYFCHLYSVASQALTEFTRSSAASLEEMAVILSTYHIPKEQISIEFSSSADNEDDALTEGEREYAKQVLFTFLSDQYPGKPYTPTEYDTRKTYPVVVYAYQLGKDSWRFVLRENTTLAGSIQDAMYGFDGMAAEHAKKALSAYGLNPSEIPVIVINSYISSFYYDIDESTVAEARQSLGLS